MTEYEQTFDFWKAFGIVVIILILLGGIGAGGWFGYKHLKTKLQTEAYQFGIDDGQRYLMGLQYQNGIVFTFDGNTTRQFKILQVEEIKNENTQ